MSEPAARRRTRVGSCLALVSTLTLDQPLLFAAIQRVIKLLVLFQYFVNPNDIRVVFATLIEYKNDHNNSIQFDLIFLI